MRNKILGSRFAIVLTCIAALLIAVIVSRFGSERGADTVVWTNTFASNFIADYAGTAVTVTLFDVSGRAIYTNSEAASGGSVILQPGSKITLNGKRLTYSVRMF